MLSESILAKIDLEYTGFTRSEKKIADYIKAHKVEAQYMTITDLAAKSGVAEATLTRFCRTLGYNGFLEFKLALAKDSMVALAEEEKELLTAVIRPLDSIEEMCQKLCTVNRDAVTRTHQMIDPAEVSRAVDFLQQAGRVYCCGQGGSSVLAMEAWSLFITATSKVQWIQDAHMQAMATSLLSPGDAVLYFSLSGSTRDLMDLARIAKARGVHLILITRSSTVPAAALADTVLLCGALEGPLQMGSVAAKMAQLYLVDVLFHEFCRRDLPQAKKNRELALDAIINKYI